MQSGAREMTHATTRGHKVRHQDAPDSTRPVLCPRTVCCYVSGGFSPYKSREQQRFGFECFPSVLGLHGRAGPVRRLAPRHRDRRCLRTHHCRGSGGKCHSDEDLSVGEVHAHRAKPVPVQSGSGGPAAAGDLRAGGRQPLPGGRVAVRPRRMQTDPVHPAHLGGRLRVHPHRSLR